jgi:hypothetical protein
MDMKLSITWPRLLRSDPRSAATGIDFRPRKFKQWIAQLPLGNIGETSRLLYGALGELNRTSMSPSTRFENLQLAHPAVDYACTALRKHFLGISFPLPEKQRKVGRLEQTLNLQMAEGYRQVARALDSRHRWGFGKGLLATSLSRALERSARALITAYQVYAPLPKELWREIHWCFLTAARHGVQNRSVDADQTAASPADIYKRLLLLDTADPFRLRQGEVEIVYSAVSRWTHLVHIHPATGKRRECGKIYLNLKVDAPPSSRSQDKLTPAQAEAVVDLSELTSGLREELSGASRGALERPKAMGSDLLRRMLLAWGSESLRRKARTKQSKAVNVAIGLRAVHHFLSVGESLHASPKRPHTEGTRSNGADARAAMILAAGNQ